MDNFYNLLDSTVYAIPFGFGSVYFTTPFAIKPRMVNGVQKFFTSTPPYPLELWENVCGSSCPYDVSMQGWEISQLNGSDVPTFIKSYSRGVARYYDDGARANTFFSTGWGQTPLYANRMPPATFDVTLINSSDNLPVTLTLPFAFGGTSGFSTARMIQGNYQSSKRDFSPLLAEELLLEALQREIVYLKRDSDDNGRYSAIEDAIRELSSSMTRFEADSSLSKDFLERDGPEALLRNSLPFIASIDQRMEMVSS